MVLPIEELPVGVLAVAGAVDGLRVVVASTPAAIDVPFAEHWKVPDRKIVEHEVIWNRCTCSRNRGRCGSTVKILAVRCRGKASTATMIERFNPLAG